MPHGPEVRAARFSIATNPGANGDLTGDRGGSPLDRPATAARAARRMRLESQTVPNVDESRAAISCGDAFEARAAGCSGNSHRVWWYVTIGCPHHGSPGSVDEYRKRATAGPMAVYAGRSGHASAQPGPRARSGRCAADLLDRGPAATDHGH